MEGVQQLVSQTWTERAFGKKIFQVSDGITIGINEEWKAYRSNVWVLGSSSAQCLNGEEDTERGIKPVSKEKHVKRHSEVLFWKRAWCQVRLASQISERWTGTHSPVVLKPTGFKSRHASGDPKENILMQWWSWYGVGLRENGWRITKASICTPLEERYHQWGNCGVNRRMKSY